MASAFTVPCETLGGEPQSVSLHTVVVVFVQARKTRLPCNASQIEQAAQAHVALDSWLANVFWGHVRHRVFVPARHESLMGISLLLALHPEQAEQIWLEALLLLAKVLSGQRRQVVLLFAVQLVCTTLLVLQVEQRIHGVSGLESSSNVPFSHGLQATDLFASPNVPMSQSVHFVKSPATRVELEYRPRRHSKHWPYVP